MSHNNSSAPTDQFSLSILYFNARSILPKIDILRAEAATRKPLVICIVESWLSHDISDDELNINGYQIHRLDRNRHGGGVLVYTHISLLYKYLPAGHSELELMSISISSPHSPGNHCISVLYRPPSSTVSFFDHLSSSLHKLSPHSFSSFVLIGDFNINFCTSDHPYFCKLNTILQYFSLTQVVQTPTHFNSGSSSLIDLALVSSVDQVLQCSTVPQLGDHDKCSFHLGISLILKCKSIVQQVKQPPRKIWRYDLADFNRANQLIDQTDWDSILINDDIDSAVQNWTNKFMEIMHACIPQLTLRKKRNVPWLNSNIVRHIRQRNSAFQAAKRSSKPNVFGKYKKLRNKVVKLLRSSKKEFYGRINLADKKQFWKTIKFLSKKQTSIPELHHLGESAKTSKAKAEMLNAFLVHVLTLLRHLYLQVMLPTWFMIALRIYCVHLVRFWASSTLLMLRKPVALMGFLLKC